jgi:hypothetical protein
MHGFSVSGTGTKEPQELARLYGATVPVVLAQGGKSLDAPLTSVFSSSISIRISTDLLQSSPF